MNKNFLLSLMLITIPIFGAARTILVTGGAGYIGSHTAWLLAHRGYHVIILDKLVHGQEFKHGWCTFIKGDYGDHALLEQIFTTYPIAAVMNFAGNIEVGESVKNPLKFYHNNVGNTITLLEVMQAHNCNVFIFSSSCAVYGLPHKLPLTEDHPKDPISPYGQTKLTIEHILHDCDHAYGLRYVALRYFNAAGGQPEHGLYEHHEPETHLIPLLLRAARTQKPFYIFGTDHSTPDGSCIRDFLHVRDIADAHLKALNYLLQGNPSDAFNLGTGNGYSVKEIIAATEQLCNTKVNVVEADKRPGDPAVLVADAHKAYRVLGWKPQYSDLGYILESAHALPSTS